MKDGKSRRLELHLLGRLAAELTEGMAGRELATYRCLSV
jgi:hypothetical protein